jgi:hypothetical protein
MKSLLPKLNLTPCGDPVFTIAIDGRPYRFAALSSSQEHGRVVVELENKQSRDVCTVTRLRDVWHCTCASYVPRAETDGEGPVFGCEHARACLIFHLALLRLGFGRPLNPRSAA